MGLAATAAVLHGLALVIVWALLSRNIARARNDRRGDYYDSLVRTAQIFRPGYLIGAALLLAAAGLGLGERRWMPVVVTVWLLLLVSISLIGRRFTQLVAAVQVTGYRRAVRLARIVVPALLIALLGLGLAGIAVQALLRAI